MIQNVTIVPSNTYIAESFYNATSEYFYNRGQRLVAASIRVRVNKEVCHTNPVEDMSFDLPADAFTSPPKDLTQNVSKTEQYNIAKSLANLDPIGGLEKIQDSYRSNFPDWDFYFVRMGIVVMAPWGPDKIQNRTVWIRQEGLTPKAYKDEGFTAKNQPYIMRLYSINETSFKDFTENERWEMIGGKPGSGFTFADGHCKLVPRKKKGKKSGANSDNFATYCANITGR